MDKLDCKFDELAKLRMSLISWISWTVSWMSRISWTVSSMSWISCTVSSMQAKFDELSKLNKLSSIS